MFLDIQSALLPGRESVGSLKQQSSLPVLSARANSTDRKSYGNRTGLVYQHHDPDKTLTMIKQNSSLSGRTSRASSQTKQDSISKLYEKVNANLMGKFNESVGTGRTENSSVFLKERQLEQERQRKNLAVTFLRTADTFGHFLEPYTAEFIQTVEQSRSEINFDINDPTEEDLNVFIEQQNNIAAVTRKVLDECVVGKILAKRGLDELGKVVVSVLDTLMAKYTKVLQACKPQLKAKNLLSEQKEQQAMMVTKNEKTLFESIRLVNFLHNPLFELDETMRQKYIHNLVKSKQILRESKTSFRIDVVNNFEEDLKKLAKIFVETRSQNGILVKENAHLKTLLDEINARYTEDQNLIKYKNQMLIKKKKEQQQQNEGESRSRSGSPINATPSMLVTLQPPQKDEDEDILLGKDEIDDLYNKALIAGGKDVIRQRSSKAADSQTFVITYLEKELRSLELDLNKSRLDIEKLKIEKNNMAKKISELEDTHVDRLAASKEVGIQCAFLSEKEGYVETESTLEKILEGKDPLKITAVEQDEEWLLMMINNIYQEKFQADLQDDYDGRCRKSLPEYCKEWFLNRFGFQQSAEVMLRDFLKTLGINVQKHPRYKTFGMLIGLSSAYDMKLPENITNASKEDTKVAGEYLKRQFIMSHYGISIFNKAVLLAKSSRCAAQFDTFLPNINQGDDTDALEIKGLVAVLRDLLVLLEVPADDMKQILGQFDMMVEGDSYFKMIEKQFEKNNAAKLNIQEEIEKGLSVRMDYFLLFILENTAACFVKDLEQVYMQIRLTNEFVNNANVTVDLYRDAFASLNIEKPQRWLEITYEVIMHKDVKHSPPLFQTFGLLAPHILFKQSQAVRGKLPEDGYPLFQCPMAGQYNEKDVITRIKKYTDLEGNYKLLRLTYQLVKASLSKYQKRAGNVDYLNDLMEKDMNSIKTAMANLKFTHRQGEKDKVKSNLDMNWRRMRMIMKARHFIPKEQQG